MNCGKCFKSVENYFKFCPKCANALEQECVKCNLRSNFHGTFCFNCGSLLRNSKFEMKTLIETQLGPLEQPTSTTTSAVESSEEVSMNIKVSIVFGVGLENIKQEAGGGWRYLLLNRNDDYDSVFKKLIKLYFPDAWDRGENVTRLGKATDYNLRMLDFQMNCFSREKFTTFDSYRQKNGLTLKAKPIFFLHLLKDLNKVNYNDINATNCNYTLPNEDQKRSSYLSPALSSDYGKIPSNEYQRKEAASKNVLSTTNFLTITKKNETRLEVLSKSKRVRSPSPESSDSSSSSDSNSSLRKKAKLDTKVNQLLKKDRTQTSPVKFSNIITIQNSKSQLHEMQTKNEEKSNPFRKSILPIPSLNAKTNIKLEAMDLLSVSTSELTNNHNSNIKSTISQANENLTKSWNNYGNKKYDAKSFDSRSNAINRNGYVQTNNNNYKNHRTYNNGNGSSWERSYSKEDSQRSFQLTNKSNTFRFPKK